ncbi:hypothetical protein AAMO2058_000266900 [Amorphochlora amoebiformis]
MAWRLRGPVDAKLLRHIETLGVTRIGRRRPKRVPQVYEKPKAVSEIVSRLFSSPVSLLAACNQSRDFPVQKEDIPEVAFAGRSNVGKSSLLKALSVKTRIHVPVADRPGTTRSLDFYQIGPFLRIIDLPGYGFAYGQQELLAKWADLIDTCMDRRQVKRVMVVVDSRHGLKDSDVELIEKLNRARKRFQIVLTKADMLPPESLARVAQHTKQQLKVHRHAVPEVMVCSSQNKGGIKEIRSLLGSLISRPPSLKEEKKKAAKEKAEIARDHLKKKIGGDDIP